ncbi:MAG: methyl-accepting chemotaxis protein [Chromatiales bacterium]|jgi:twitching motility protein PilJ
MKFSLKGQTQAVRRTYLFTGLALFTIALAIIAFIHVTTWEKHEAEYLLRAAEQRVVAQEIAKYSLEAAGGNNQAFAQLKDARDYFERIMKEIKSGDAKSGLPPAPDNMHDSIRNMENSWLELRQVADEVLLSQDAILTVDRFIAVINQFIPEVSELSDQVVMLLIKSKVPQDQIYTASRQLMLAQRIQHNVNKVLAGGALTAAALDQFSRDTEEFGRVLNGMLKGDSKRKIAEVKNDQAVKLLQEIEQLFTSINDHAAELVEVTPVLLPALDAAGEVARVSDRVNEASQDLIDRFSASPGLWKIANVQIGVPIVTGLAFLSAVFLVLLAWSLVAGANARQKETAEQNERNQEAILKLLDEMGDLADGDLTVTATVTEDITGAIADSINYAIEALRSLVTTINETSVQVSASAQESRATAMHLAEASEHQAEQITSATESVTNMSTELEDLAGDANESADVAQRSVEIANKGAAAVRDTIHGMDNIREQIQETSKRIKRLGESSQQIGDIVELIDDIADQTNILALNAAMQAAMAGEAGRGFAVVADEVQRLAERSSNATKQIEALVKTIQADTNEAVSSMETSTTEVVSGAKLAEGAGDALNEIENVSNYIADITGKMAISAKQQADGAIQVKTNMGVIQEIASQTREGSNQSAASIGTLADLADELSRSVAGFRLPD